MHDITGRSPFSWLPRVCLVFVTGIMTSFPIPVCGDTLSQLSDVFTYTPPPRYPAEAVFITGMRYKRVEGRVICRVTLDAAGKVAGVKVATSSGNKFLDQAAAEALSSWRAKQGRSGRFYDVPIAFKAGASTPTLPVPNDGLGLSRGR